MSPLVPLGKFVILAGGCLVAVGVVMMLLGRVGGRLLPGDIVIERPGFSFYFPIGTSIALSILLTLILLLINLLRR